MSGVHVICLTQSVCKIEGYCTRLLIPGLCILYMYYVIPKLICCARVPNSRM
jgi:hypothetical protein